MRVEITTRHCELSDFLKERVRSRVEKLRRFDDALKDARVVVSFEKNRYRIEAVVQANGGQLVSHAVEGTRRAAIEQVLNRLEAQVKKHRERVLKGRKRTPAAKERSDAPEAEEEADGAEEAFGEESDYDGLVGEDLGAMDGVMMLAEAAAMLRASRGEALGFVNKATGRRVVLFKRRDGRIGMIEVPR